MYTFSEYLIAKVNNSILERFEGFCDYMSHQLGMPVFIAGLHTGLKHSVSGVEKHIKQITPRCVLTYNGLDIDRNAMTSLQASTEIESINEVGGYGEHVVEYRRLPLQGGFQLAIIMDNAALAIRMTEYIAMLSLFIPTCDGDKHTQSTIILAEQISIENNEDTNNYVLTGTINLNMQVVEPMTLAKTDRQYPLAGVGLLADNGTWDETLKGEPTGTYDDDGNPILGNFVSDGWYRLHVNYTIKTLGEEGEGAKMSTGAGAEQTPL